MRFEQEYLKRAAEYGDCVAESFAELTNDPTISYAVADMAFYARMAWRYAQKSRETCK